MYRMGQEEADATARVLASKQLFRIGDAASGHLGETERFETEWAGAMGAKHALLMAGGGTAALVCSLAALGMGPGDEVIVPAYTWLATASAVLTVGAIPVLADVDETLALDPLDLAAKVTPETRAVIPVHMVGRPANLDSIGAVARDHGLRVVEDTCQAIGGSYRGQPLGSHGDAGAYSLNWYKIISTGEGGVLVTNDRELYERALVYHDSGAAFRPNALALHTPIFIAQQYRTNEVSAAIARVQLGRLPGILQDLRRHQRMLREAAAGSQNVRVAPDNDADGDCGVMAMFQCDTPERARSFQEMAPDSTVLIDHGKHVYSQWEPILAKRIGHHPAMNPYNFPQNARLRRDIAPDSCARTLDILRRTVCVRVDPDWTEAEADERASLLRRAAMA